MAERVTKRPLAYSFLIIFFCIGSIVTTHTQVPYPEVTFSYDLISKCIDSVGCLFFKNNLGFKKIDATQTEQFVKKALPNLIASWKQQAPILFGEVFSFFKHGFKQKKRLGIIALGCNVSYGSRKILFLGLRSYLDSEPWEVGITREDAFATLVFHELLHVWVDENIGDKSALLAKYRNENFHVRDHIHLMAIQKMVYVNLNRSDILHDIDECYRRFASCEYRRAWEIVNDIEGYEAVIQDILDKLQCKNNG